VSVKPSPIDWIKEADEPIRTYRKMVIGWQNSVTALNSTVVSFNAEYLKQEQEKHKGTNQLMREIAIKKLVIASLFELKPQLDKWYNTLDEVGLLSDQTKQTKKDVRHVIGQIAKYDGIRNAAFHYGDVNEKSDELIQLYEDIQKLDLSFLNRILTDLIKLGYQLRDDASKMT
jgi:hypothetical protein